MRKICQRLGDRLTSLRANERGRYTGLILIVFICIIGPGLAQVVISYTPGVSKGTFSLFEAIGSGRLFVEGEQWYLSDEPEILVTGMIRPPQSAENVILEANGEPYTDGPLELWGPGGFRAMLPLTPGPTTVLARGPWGSRAAVRVLYVPEQLTPISRTLSVALSTDRASSVYSAAYPRDVYEQELQDLPAGALGAGLFVQRVFYPGETDFSGPWPWPAPAFAVAGDRITVGVSASGSPYSQEDIGHVLRLTPQTGVSTTVTVSLEGVGLTSLPHPGPTTWRDDRLEWVDPSEPIAIEYEADPSARSGSAWLGRLWADVQAAMGRVGGTLNLIALPLVPLVPFLWLLLPSGLRRLGPAGSGTSRNLLLVLGLLMWLVPLAAYVVPFPRILHDLLAAVRPGVADSVSRLPRYPPEVSLWGAAMTFALLLPWVHRLGLSQVEGRARWLRWFGLTLAALLLNLILLLFEGYLSLLLFPAAILVLLTWTWLMCEIYDPGRSRFRGTFSSWPAAIGLAAILAILAYPVTTTASGLDPAEGWQLQHWAQFYLILGSLLLPYTVLLALVPLLRARRSDRLPPARARPHRLMGLLIFAVYVIGFLGARLGSVQWLPFNLIPFIIAVLWVYPGLVERAGRWDAAPGVKQELDARPDAVAELRRMQWRAKHQAGGEHSDKNNQADEGAKLPEDYHVRRAVFAFGPTSRPWENAKLSCGYGLILSTALFLLYAPFIFARAEELVNTPFPLLQILGAVLLPFFSRWLLAAFLLGYFFPYIRGTSGLQKGLTLAVGIAACTLPSNVLLLGSTMGDPLALLWEAGQTVLFLTALGLWAFDWNTARRYGLGWGDVLSAEGLAVSAPYLSSVVAAVGGVASSFISGRAEEIIESVLELLLRGAPPF